MGWLIVIMDMNIYMLYEGRRYWPRWLRNVGLKSERNRLRKLLINFKNTRNTDNIKYLENSVELRRFPVNEKNGNFYVFYPARLGNLLYAYEQHAKRAYGMDSTFYWYRIWISINDELRENIDSQQSLVDSSLYVSFSLVIAGLMSGIYLIAKTLNYPWLQNLPSYWLLAGLGFVCMVISYLLYRGSLHIQSKYGEFYKSLFDMYKNKINVDDVIEEVSIISNDSSLKSASNFEKYNIAWRYLHNFRYKDKEGKIMKIPISRLRAKSKAKQESVIN